MGHKQHVFLFEKCHMMNIRAYMGVSENGNTDKVAVAIQKMMWGPTYASDIHIRVYALYTYEYV